MRMAFASPGSCCWPLCFMAGSSRAHGGPGPRWHGFHSLCPGTGKTSLARGHRSRPPAPLLSADGAGPVMADAVFPGHHLRDHASECSTGRCPPGDFAGRAHVLPGPSPLRPARRLLGRGSFPVLAGYGTHHGRYSVRCPVSVPGGHRPVVGHSPSEPRFALAFRRLRPV